MTYALRPYQQRALDDLFAWWGKHPGIDQAPICVLPTGAGKSVVLAELCRLLFDQWPADHPRTVVLVPSKELAEQNAEKLRAMLPTRLSVGYYSASLGRKVPDADVIVATIGSIYKAAHLLGNIRCVVIDECHGVNPNGADAGRYRQFLSSLARLCEFRVCGFTATPFRGNGVWLTDGEAPLFTGIACSVTITDLIAQGYLAPLVRPIDVIRTRIDTSDIEITSTGDYNVADLSARIEDYLPAAAQETVRIAADRRKWIAFCTTVANAEHFVRLLREQGVSAMLVCGETPKDQRAERIADFRAGRVRCLVTVLALATGFDAPDVDCIVWLRPTRSPVLYVQGFGRGFRIAPGKSDCLCIDFSDTSERLGPIDTIKGRRRGAVTNASAPCIICDNCGARVVPASTIICPECGHVMREPEPEVARQASDAPILSTQIQQRIVEHEVTRVAYSRHSKPGKPDTLRVDYYEGIRRVASEWIPLDAPAGSWAGGKAARWWSKRKPARFDGHVPGVAQALEWIEGGFELARPASVVVNESGQWPEIIQYVWDEKAIA